MTVTGKVLSKEAGPEENTFWLKQNTNKSSDWAQLARKGHEVFHLMNTNRFGRASGFAGKIRIDGKVMSYDEARDKYGC
jgi:hypothetical protein